MALTQEKYLEVKQIIDDIYAGRKDHVQAHYHCGTAHCIAGWLEVNELVRRGLSTNFTGTYPSEDEWSHGGSWIDDDYILRALTPVVKEMDKKLRRDTWGWAQKYLDIDVSESELLFDPCLTLGDIEENLDLIAKNAGLTTVD